MRRKIPATATLPAFEAAARHQSFTRTASELALTQDAVCRQGNGLEEILGFKLFQHTRSGVLLTPAGWRRWRAIPMALMAHQGRTRFIELAELPLLPQSTRPYVRRDWFVSADCPVAEAQHYRPSALSG